MKRLNSGSSRIVIVLPAVLVMVVVFVVQLCNGTSSGDMAAWVGSLGTVGAFFAVLYSIGDERRNVVILRSGSKPTVFRHGLARTARTARQSS